MSNVRGSYGKYNLNISICIDIYIYILQIISILYCLIFEQQYYFKIFKKYIYPFNLQLLTLTQTPCFFNFSFKFIVFLYFRCTCAHIPIHTCTVKINHTESFPCYLFESFWVSWSLGDNLDLESLCVHLISLTVRHKSINMPNLLLQASHFHSSSWVCVNKRNTVDFLIHRQDPSRIVSFCVASLLLVLPTNMFCVQDTPHSHIHHAKSFSPQNTFAPSSSWWSTAQGQGGHSFIHQHCFLFYLKIHSVQSKKIMVMPGKLGWPLGVLTLTNNRRPRTILFNFRRKKKIPGTIRAVRKVQELKGEKKNVIQHSGSTAFQASATSVSLNLLLPP